ncbi:right-handed parallel beta-helix repeat-containing protein [Parvularcula sp. ZS-1/3]|uniref:Right-handed parallel beta-helix repeat-containing protein n=1 Tax=Parvularcula mediterranea TaxID=2732508 RepID=A0A7Y3W414_9PROT|nr:right-handed parallel beta-helix repeat-containing protein [Parvularcula mediterranea]NNU15008.1 right-handed parallel beta-helix repeat-containing protein [Parvularcula mediterranea]
MARKTTAYAPRLLLAATALAFAVPTAASAQIGGFETEISKAKKKKAKVKKQPIVDVRLDPNWEGPKSISEALKLVEADGQIVVHPGVYQPEAVNIRKNVSIRGIRDDYGKAPTLTAKGSCLNVNSASVSARVSDLTFRASDRSCINVSMGSLELTDSNVLGKRAGAGYAYSDPSGHLTPFTPESAMNAKSALVSIKGGRVRISNSTITGGDTGVLIAPNNSNAFDHVDLQNNTISQMSGVGVVMRGDVDATLASNTIVSNQMSGVVYAATGHARLVGNIISNNTHNGLFVQGMGEAVSIEGNKIHDNSEDGIEVRSGIAILVNNDIGEHKGCKVNPNAPAEGTSDHLAMPPIRLLADSRGVNTYDTSQACTKKTAKKKKRGLRRG